jgi:beta-galactosidase
MSNFYARNGQFWIDDQPQFVHAAEFHYFRTPREEWRQRLGLLLDAGFNTVALYIPWLWHETEEGVTDVDGHSHPMRDLAGFLDLATEMGFWLIPRPGPYIMAETINEGIPPWVFDKYPQVALINQREEPQNIVSYLHPDFLAAVKNWYEAVFAVLTPRQITHGGKSIMIQLDNEMGMPHWVRNIFDINPDTLTRFAAYLLNQYGSQLSDRYPTDDLPAFLRESLIYPSASDGAEIVEDYRRFYRDYLYQYMDFLWQTARSNGMEVLPVVNVHGFTNHRGGRTFPIGLSQLIKVIEMPDMITATDVYPLHIGEDNIHQLILSNEMTKAVQNPNQALFSIEFQSGGNNDFSGTQSSLYDLHSRLCISQGMRAINHYLFTAGTNDPILSPIKRHDWGPPIRNDGTVRRHYPRYGRLSKVLNSYGEALILAQPQTVTTIGYLLDDFMTEVNTEATQQATAIIDYLRDVVLFDFIGRGLTLTHRPYEVVELSLAELDVAKTPTLWMMINRVCPATVQEKLLQYVYDGGNLILVGRICEVDVDGTPSSILRDALGIEAIKSDLPLVYTDIQIFNYPDVPVAFVESYQGNFDEGFANRPNGEVVGFVKSLGEGSGRVMMLGAALPANTLEDIDLVHQMALKMGCPPLFELSDWADVRLSRGERGNFLYINNYQDDPISTTVAYEGEMLFGGNPINLPARRGLILPLEWMLNNEVMVHYATGEVTNISMDEQGITLIVEPPDFIAELTVTGYHCDDGTVIDDSNGKRRVRIQGKNGQIQLAKDG